MNSLRPCRQLRHPLAPPAPACAGHCTPVWSAAASLGVGACRRVRGGRRPQAARDALEHHAAAPPPAPASPSPAADHCTPVWSEAGRPGDGAMGRIVCASRRTSRPREPAAPTPTASLPRSGYRPRTARLVGSREDGRRGSLLCPPPYCAAAARRAASSATRQPLPLRLPATVHPCGRQLRA